MMIFLIQWLLLLSTDLLSTVTPFTFTFNHPHNRFARVGPTKLWAIQDGNQDDQPSPWEELDRLIEKRGGAPDNMDELRKLAVEKLEEAEEDIKRERQELKDAIEEERLKADSAREDRTIAMSVELDDKIDAMIGGFMSDVGGGKGELKNVGTVDVDGGGGDEGGVVSTASEIKITPTTIAYVPLDDDVPPPYPSSTSQSSPPSKPTTLVIGANTKSLNPKSASSFVKDNDGVKWDVKAIEKVVVIGNLGTERTGKFPWNIQNGLGGTLTKNKEGEQVLLDHFRKACKGNLPPLCTYVLKVGEGDLDDEARSGGLLLGTSEDRASLLIGDKGKGGCYGNTIERIVGLLAEEREGLKGNVTASVFSWGEGGGDEEINMLMEKLEGPEVDRIIIDVKDGAEAERRAVILLGDVIKGMEKGGKTVTKVELDARAK